MGNGRKNSRSELFLIAFVIGPKHVCVIAASVHQFVYLFAYKNLYNFVNASKMFIFYNIPILSYIDWSIYSSFQFHMCRRDVFYYSEEIICTRTKAYSIAVNDIIYDTFQPLYLIFTLLRYLLRRFICNRSIRQNSKRYSTTEIRKYKRFDKI